MIRQPQIVDADRADLDVAIDAGASERGDRPLVGIDGKDRRDPSAVTARQPTVAASDLHDSTAALARQPCIHGGELAPLGIDDHVLSIRTPTSAEQTRRDGTVVANPLASISVWPQLCAPRHEGGL